MRPRRSMPSWRCRQTLRARSAGDWRPHWRRLSSSCAAGQADLAALRKDLSALEHKACPADTLSDFLCGVISGVSILNFLLALCALATSNPKSGSNYPLLVILRPESDRLTMAPDCRATNLLTACLAAGSRASHAYSHFCKTTASPSNAALVIMRSCSCCQPPRQIPAMNSCSGCTASS